jgi:hypothetical protein
MTARTPIAVSYGAGTNSTAMLVLLWRKGITPDLISFADTGGEKPHTYQHIETMQNWLKSIGFPQIIIVKKQYRGGEIANLFDHSVSRKMLPSLAYGFKKCSQKFKIQPQIKLKNNFPLFKEHWKAGGKVLNLIGYDIDEPNRVQNSLAAVAKDKKYYTAYPLYEEGMTREDCIELIKSEGLPAPGKSACFFCPASKLPEIAALKNTYPDLYRAALDMEGNAELTSVKGLGRRFAWKDADLTRFKDETYAAELEGEDFPCGCYDG